MLLLKHPVHIQIDKMTEELMGCAKTFVKIVSLLFDFSGFILSFKFVYALHCLMNITWEPKDIKGLLRFPFSIFLLDNSLSYGGGDISYRLLLVG